jgi:hypothetical protein
MDWKAFYRDELASEAGRAAIGRALVRHAGGDEALTSALRGGGIVSFPHTTLADSAEPIARAAQSVISAGAARVVALGVLHGGTLPEPHRNDLAELSRGSPRAAELFRRLGGAFVATGAATTPWGDVPCGPVPAATGVMRADAALLANEFSLDLFLAVLAAASRRRAVATPVVTRIFVSATRDPSGSFAAAARVADGVRGLLGDGAVCVATGDLVHYGHSYSPPEAMAGMPSDTAGLESRFRERVGAMLAAGLARRDEEAYAMATNELRSDQRNLMPVIAELTGPGAAANVLSFRLSDYSAINGVAAPCLVASALVAFRPSGELSIGR